MRTKQRIDIEDPEFGVSVENVVDRVCGHLVNVQKQIREDGAPKSSPILVLKRPGHGRFITMFARTIESQKRIQGKDPDIIGVFDSSTSPEVLRQKLWATLND